jgi:hypothetical protein
MKLFKKCYPPKQGTFFGWGGKIIKCRFIFLSLQLFEIFFVCVFEHSPIDKNPIEQNSLNEFDLEQLINKKRNNDIPVIMNIQNILNKDSKKNNNKKRERRRKRKRKTEPIIAIDLVDSPPLDFSQFPIYPIPSLVTIHIYLYTFLLLLFFFLCVFVLARAILHHFIVYGGGSFNFYFHLRLYER